MYLRYNLYKNIVCECNLLRPVLDVRTKLNFNRRICDSLAVKYSVLIYCLIKMICRIGKFYIHIRSCCEIALVSRCCSN